MTATPEALSMATVAARAASAKLGENISVIDVPDQLVITHHFVIASASNDRQVRAIVDEEFEALLAGSKTAQEALDAAVERGNQILRDFEAANQ